MSDVSFEERRKMKVKKFLKDLFRKRTAIGLGNPATGFHVYGLFHPGLKDREVSPPVGYRKITLFVPEKRISSFLERLDNDRAAVVFGHSDIDPLKGIFQGSVSESLDGTPLVRVLVPGR